MEAHGGLLACANVERSLSTTYSWRRHEGRERGINSSRTKMRNEGEAEDRGERKCDDECARKRSSRSRSRGSACSHAIVRGRIDTANRGSSDRNRAPRGRPSDDFVIYVVVLSLFAGSACSGRANPRWRRGAARRIAGSSIDRCPPANRYTAIKTKISQRGEMLNYSGSAGQQQRRGEA